MCLVMVKGTSARESVWLMVPFLCETKVSCSFDVSAGTVFDSPMHITLSCCAQQTALVCVSCFTNATRLSSVHVGLESHTQITFPRLVGITRLSGILGHHMFHDNINFLLLKCCVE